MNAPLRMMLPQDVQLSNEYRYSKKHVDRYISQEIATNPHTEAKVQAGVALLQQWINATYYASKEERLDQVRAMLPDDDHVEELVRKVFVNVAYCQIPELFTSVTGKLASVLKMSDRAESVTTIGEILAVLCATDAYDIMKLNDVGSLMVQSLIPLSDELLNYVQQVKYLPPLVCEPQKLTSNFESPYLTHNDCLILGKGNSHTEDICLDVINTQNQVAMKLDLEFLKRVEEEPSEPITRESVQKAAREKGRALNDTELYWEVRKQQDAWMRFKVQSYETYLLMAKQGNRFWFANKVDKRGRLYSQGYHINPQGSAFKKAMLEFADDEVVTGVPKP